MAESVNAIACAGNQWTLISQGKASVAFQWRGDTDYGKWTFGTSLPDNATPHFWTLRPKSPQSLNQLTIGTNVYAMPFGDETQIMEVVAP